MRYQTNCFLRLCMVVITCIIWAGNLSAQTTETTIKKGDVITQSISVKKGNYYFGKMDSLATVLVVRGNNITIDFNGAVLSGSRPGEDPDKFEGIGIRIEGGKNVILKNAVIRGFRVGVLADDADGLQLINNDLSFNFRQRLKSNRFKENLSDWQSYHHNDHDQWLRFGAGMYIKNSDNVVITGNNATDGQCALLMSLCNDAQIYNNNFSFNSGLGIGMYKSNRNTVMNNKIDWNVRGYSYGYYYRGQDSGGILIFDQCSNNVFANNSATHSGDGFFLWAGQETIDNGTGGCNDNLIYGNDFSYAPTNAVEVTFSRNKVIRNKLKESWHGIWGGFSYNTIIAGNEFGGNLAAISIEHGQDNIIQDNRFIADSIGVEIWAIPNRRADFGLMNKKDTRSRDYLISDNYFENVPLVYSIKNTQNVTLAGNKATGYRTLEKIDTLVTGLKRTGASTSYDYAADSLHVASLLKDKKLENPWLPSTHPIGKKKIMMTEWGPYNFEYPILWWTKTDADGTMYFDVEGPEGKWKVKKLEGVQLKSASSGSFPGKLVVKKKDLQNNRLDIRLEYNGAAFTDPFGVVVPKGKKYIFSHTDHSLPMQWNVSWYKFDSTNDPVKHPEAFQQLIAGKPLHTAQMNALDYDKVKGKFRDLPQSRFATVVETEVDAPKGTYRLGVTAGDIVKVYIDGKLVIDSWVPEAIKYDADYYKEAKVKLNGKHKISIVQAQYGWYGMLELKLSDY